MRVVVVVVCASCSFRPAAVTSNSNDDARAAQDAFVFHDGAPPDWWNTQWTYRMPLAIHDPVALAMDFQVGFAVDLDAAPCSGSRDNARVVHDQTELVRVIDEVAPQPWLWFRLDAPLAADTTSTGYWLYCNNPSAPPAPADPQQVFDLYDDFAGAALGSAWSSAGTLGVGGGVVTLQNNATFHTTATYPPNTAVDFVMAPQAGPPSMWFWGGFQNGTATAAPWTLWNTRNEAGIHPEINDGQGGTAAGSAIAFDTSPRMYGVEEYGAASTYRLADAPVQTIAHGHAIAASISVRFDNYSSGANTMQVDMARVRRAVNPPPTVTVGLAQTFTP